MEVAVTEHFYTTDFYQQSAFDPTQQIISIYYQVTPLQEITVPIRTTPFQFDDAQLKVYEATGETETFRFIDWQHFSPDNVSLPIDKVVARLIKEKF